MPNARRGEVWQIDFGLAAKVRPALVLGCDVADEDRVLVAVVYHTTALRGSRYEVPMNVPGLDAGGFDAQSIYTVPAIKLIRRRAILTAAQLKQVEEKLKLWLGLA